RGQCARLAAEAFQTLYVITEHPGKSLDGHVTTELAVVSTVDLAHASLAEKPSPLILAQIRAFAERRYPFLSEQGAGVRQCAPFQRTGTGIGLRQQRLDLAA